MFAFWIPGKTQDGIVESSCDITIPNVQAERAWVIDIFNGTKQELVITCKGENTALKDMLIKDYPVFVRLKK
jgi:hypothetical protein